MKELKELFEKLGISPKHTTLYEQAFTHSSYNADANTKHQDYERLEFLGDAVIDCVVGEMVFVARPDLDQGPLTKLRSALVSTQGLSEISRKLGLYDYIRLGKSFSGDIKQANHILEDVFESFIGAMYLDQGYAKTRTFLADLFIESVKKHDIDSLTDYKSKLQEEIQSEHRESVSYELVSEEGPAHDRTYTIRVVFDGMELGTGTGKTKQQAEQMAAKEALQKEAGK